jgi:CRP-like cAMP-binding protein
VPAHRRSQRRSWTFWFKFEIGRSESPAEADARRAPVEAAAGAVARSHGIRAWFGRARRRGIPEQTQQPRADIDHPSRPEHTVSDLTQRPAARPAMSSFWEQLDPTEQAALVSVGYLATFAIGDRLMREGEPADCVIVILDGQTRICVDENGWERVLAERGPGQLIGERGGLQVRLRSASVIAIEPVRGLVVTTEAFSAFVNAHPRVFDIVEGQLYDRLAEDRARYRDHSGPGSFSSASEVRQPVAAWPGEAPAVRPVRSGPLNGQHCTVLLTDVVAFGSPARNDEDRRIIRKALLAMTDLMLQGIAARSEDRGDGILTIVPPDIPTAEVLERLVKELPLALARHNSTFPDSARFQLRVAINVGPVTTDTMGVSGEAIIIVARLVDAPIFKEAMAKTHVNLGIIASPFVYDTVIKHSPNPMNVVGYSQVQVNLKGFATPAWIKLFSMPTPSFYAAQSTAANSIGAYNSAMYPIAMEPRH